MRALRLATVAVLLSFTVLQSPAADAQILTTGEGVCRVCGHSEIDTQRYVNSFLNQMFFPNRFDTRTAVAASLYLLTATYTMHGRLSPEPNLSSVTIAITAEVANALPTGRYRVTTTTAGGETSTKTYAIGSERFSVFYPYAPGALNSARDQVANPGGGGSGGRSGPQTSGGPGGIRGGSRGPAKCSRSRREDRRNETIVWCSRD